MRAVFDVVPQVQASSLAVELKIHCRAAPTMRGVADRSLWKYLSVLLSGLNHRAITTPQGFSKFDQPLIAVVRCRLDKDHTVSVLDEVSR